jgi:hypothetical protein
MLGEKGFNSQQFKPLYRGDVNEWTEHKLLISTTESVYVDFVGLVPVVASEMGRLVGELKSLPLLIN